MNFNKECPSLKEKECNILSRKETTNPISIYDNKDGTYTILEDNEVVFFLKGFFKEDIQEHCLDKQRVKEIIDRITNNQISNRMAEISKCSEEIRNILKELKKELKL